MVLLSPARSEPPARHTPGALSRPLSVVPGARLDRCADHVVGALERAGVDTFYGVPGGAISPIYDALLERPHLRVVHVRHETSALFMAIGHSRVRPGSLPCVLVTSGPGVTNAVTGLAAALGEGVPVLVLGGEVPRSKFGRRALQEGSSEAIDVVSIVRSVTRSAGVITSAGNAPFQVAAAAQEARTRRGPVFLSLPLDVAVTPTPSPLFTAPIAARRSPPPASIAAAASALAEARHPLLLVGSGAREAWRAVRAFAERLGLPVITSPKAKGIVDERASHCLGVFGYGGHPSATDWLDRQPPDVVLALGCGLNEPSTNSWSRLLQATHTMIQVDLDPSQLGRNYRTDIGIEGDCGEVLAALDERLRDCAPWCLGLHGIRHLPLDPSTEHGLSPAEVIGVIQSEMPHDTVFTSDIGEHLLFALHGLWVAHPDGLIASLALGSMGSGIGAAIGARLAAPERPVVSICGDYGFQMFGAELSTCVQEGLGVVFAVMNDARMRMVEAGVQRNYGRAMAMDGPRIDFAALARAHGAHGCTIDTLDALRTAIATRPSAGPTVLDVRIDPSARFPANARAQEISNFTAR